MAPEIPYAPATVSQQSSSHTPVLSAGHVTIAAVRVWENNCRRFFQHKSIAEADRVQSIIFNFEGSNMQAWVNTNLARLTSLTYPAFVLKFKKKFLPRNWQDDLVSTQIQMQGLTAFLSWTEAVREANAELGIAKSGYHIEDDKLRAHFVPRLSPALKLSYNAANTHGDLDKIMDLDAWVECVHLLDIELENKRAEWLKVAMEGHQGTTKVRSILRNSSIANVAMNPNTASNSSTSARPSSSYTGPGTPKLTQVEYDLLKAHRGCFRCHLFYIGHLAPNCTLGPDERPSPEACKNCTLPNALKAKAAFEKKQASTTVAAVFGGDSEDSNVSLGDEEADEYMDSYLSFPSHLWWTCCIDAPATCAPTPIRALIDHGSTPVLILSEFADIMCLPRRKLFKPLSVSGAFVNKSKNSDDVSVLAEYCKLHLQSQDSSWKARVVNAIICPNLYTDVILGLDFLARNKIVVDAHLRTAIVKESNYDLLNDQPCTLLIPRLSPHQRRKAEKTAIRSSQAETRKLRVLVHCELFNLFEENPARFNFDEHTTSSPDLVAAIRARIEQLAGQKILLKLNAKYKLSFKDCFPNDIPHTTELPKDIYHHIEIKLGLPISVGRAYSCPRKYRTEWKALIDQHFAAGRIRPSSSPYASPSFIIPKADPTVLPRWVNDYQKLNSVTIPDHYPLPRIDDILADCSKGKIWGKIDMTNSFFQTLVHPDHVKYTATLMPFGLWEWVVMPMGLRNSPATHQRRVTLALTDLIGKICHVYLDDIIIWSSSLAEHKINMARVLEALRTLQLYCSLKKSQLFCTEIDFLGHHISARGIEADTTKVERIMDWPAPTSAKHVRQFLGIIRYISAFLPGLAEHTAILTPLTKKECNATFLAWTSDHQRAFDAIKGLVLSRDCLTSIEHHDPGNKKIYVTCDASKRHTGAVLSFGETWEALRPVAFKSRQMKGAELHYPVHEQELLSIMRALAKWHADLLGTHIYIYTDHKTLQNFDSQRDLSLRQARWMEYLSQYEHSITYIKGEDNTVADALSQLPIDKAAGPLAVTATFTIENDPKLFSKIRKGYTHNTWCAGILDDLKRGVIDSKLDIKLKNGLLFVGSRLVIPKYLDLREQLFRLAHDHLGHFGGEKTYASLRDEYYWPNMRRDLLTAYVPACAACQRNKSRTHRTPGPLHPLPIPDRRFESVAIDFIGPLPLDDDVDQIVTMTDRLGADIQLAACSTKMTAEEFANLFFNKWYCENGCPVW
jgi:hypothetical protein